MNNSAPQPLDKWTILGAEGCCRSLNASLWSVGYVHIVENETYLLNFWTPKSSVPKKAVKLNPLSLF